MRKRRLLVALGVVAAALVIAGVVQASIPDSSGVAHGCYLTKGKLSQAEPRPGDLRLIDTDAGQHCATDEQPVDLATPQYVQNVATSTVNQTVVTGSFTFGTFTAGDHWIQWTCGGWVAVNPTVSVAGTVSNTSSTQAPIALHAVMNVESQNAGTTNAPFGTTVRNYFSLSSPQAIHTQVQCVDPRVFGETFPVSAPARVTATAQ
jgi:hypothetical protein